MEETAEHTDSLEGNLNATVLEGLNTNDVGGESIVSDIFDLDGSFMVVFAALAGIFLWRATRFYPDHAKPLKVLAFGVLLLGVNAGSGLLWELLSDKFDAAELIETLIEILAMAITALGGLLLYLQGSRRNQ